MADVTNDHVATLRLLAKCGSMDLSMLGPIAHEMEALQRRLNRHEPVSLYNGPDIEWWKNEAERQKRYALKVESYLDRETLKEVLTQWRKSSHGKDKPLEPAARPSVQIPLCEVCTARINGRRPA